MPPGTILAVFSWQNGCGFYGTAAAFCQQSAEMDSRLHLLIQQ
jgi:hypothetical protein